MTSLTTMLQFIRAGKAVQRLVQRLQVRTLTLRTIAPIPPSLPPKSSLRSATIVNGMPTMVYPGLCTKTDWPACNTGTLFAVALPADHNGDPFLTNWTKPAYNPIQVPPSPRPSPLCTARTAHITPRSGCARRRTRSEIRRPPGRLQRECEGSNAPSLHRSSCRPLSLAAASGA
jgi:hypothetical protein